MLPVRLCVLAVVALTLFAGLRAEGSLVVYDSFSDTAIGDPLVQTSDPATGFSGEWKVGGYNTSVGGNYLVQSGSLSFGSLETAGNHVSTAETGGITGVTRDLSSFLGDRNPGTLGTPAYFSVVLRPDGDLSGGTYNNFFGLYLRSSLGNDIFIGKPGNGPIGDYVVENRGGTGQVDSGVAAVTGQTALLVLRVDFNVNSAADTFTLYVNPTPGGPEPLSGAVKPGTDIGSVIGLNLYSTGAFSADEIRVGTTYADVVPAAVPEPSSLLLLAMGGMGAFGIHRFRNRSRV